MDSRLRLNRVERGVPPESLVRCVIDRRCDLRIAFRSQNLFLTVAVCLAFSACSNAADNWVYTELSQCDAESCLGLEPDPAGCVEREGRLAGIEYLSDRVVIDWIAADFTYSSEDCSTELLVELSEPISGRAVVFDGRRIQPTQG